jgi:hypothetical protein
MFMFGFLSRIIPLGYCHVAAGSFLTRKSGQTTGPLLLLCCLDAETDVGRLLGRAEAGWFRISVPTDSRDVCAESQGKNRLQAGNSECRIPGKDTRRMGIFSRQRRWQFGQK